LQQSVFSARREESLENRYLLLRESEAAWEDQQMQVVINGENRNFEAPLTLAALVQVLGMKTDRVAVELNRDIVPRDQWDRTQIADGDRLEIVHFVGGGSL